MTNKKRMRPANAKKIEARKGTRRTTLKSKPRDKEGLQLTDYLLEAHPELGFFVDDAKLGKSET
jgi:hypothetical protein